jgi:PAS domain S-box-containing protein
MRGAVRSRRQNFRPVLWTDTPIGGIISENEARQHTGAHENAPVRAGKQRVRRGPLLPKGFMKIHRTLIVLVGIGMLLIILITVSSLGDITSAFSHTTRGMGQITSEFQRIWNIEKKVHDMALAVHHYVESGGEERYRQSYQVSQMTVHALLSEIGKLNSDRKETALLGSVAADLDRLEKKADRIFSLPSPAGRDKALASDLVIELDGLLAWMGNDVEKYQRENAAEMSSILDELVRNKERINIFFLITLATSAGFLLAFGLYLYRKVSVPLNDLWGGTEAISRGNLDFQMRVHGDGDIARLGERFNEMALRLRQSYAELQQKLFDRTRELAALDAVALTLSQAGTLKDVLDKSLMKILNSLAEIEPKGGVFLCDPGGESLRLIVQHGLSPEFSQREAVIRMGECLCGMVAQTGELLYSGSSCGDPRHTRGVAGESHSHIIIPIKSRGIVLGVIFVYPRQDFKLLASDIQMLEAIGVQLGMAVENFRFYAEVKESSEKFWDLFENSRDILFTTDAEGRLTAVNREAERFSGYSKVELFGKSVLDFLTPEGAERAKGMLFGDVKSKFPWTEFEIIKRDGGRAFIEVSVRRIMKDGARSGFQISARDMTERKNLRELLVKAERLGAIGQVGVAVRHEINNPLTTVIGNIELLIERYEDKDRELAARLETILNNAVRIGEIVKRLQGIKEEKVVDYLKGVKMTDLKEG